MSLDFHDKLDIDAFKKKCEDLHKIARRYPAYDIRMATLPEFAHQIGPWSLRFALEVWKAPYMWHGSAAIVEQIGYTTEIGTLGMKYEVPQDALLSISSWVEDHRQQARFILAEIFGDILRPGDKFQPANETLGLWAMHWMVEYTGPKTWLSRQH